MIVVLKVILSLFIIATAFVIKFVYSDFTKVRKTDGYDNLSIWEKIRFGSIFFFIITALTSLLVFLGYFVITPIQLL